MNLVRIQNKMYVSARDIFIKPQQIFDPRPWQIANKKICCVVCDLRWYQRVGGGARIQRAWFTSTLAIGYHIPFALSILLIESDQGLPPCNRNGTWLINAHGPPPARRQDSRSPLSGSEMLHMLK
jgi:hypothetical protein